MPEARYHLLEQNQEAVAQRVAAHDYDQVLGTGWGSHCGRLATMRSHPSSRSEVPCGQFCRSKFEF